MGEAGTIRDRLQLAPTVGVTVTLAFTVLFALLPAAVPLEELKNAVFRVTGVWVYGNPIAPVRFLGGVVGGFVTGLLLDRSWGEALPVIVKSVLGGLAGAYVLYVALSGVVAFLSGSVPFTSIVFVPLVLALPLAAVYALGGLVGGSVGLWIRAEFVG